MPRLESHWSRCCFVLRLWLTAVLFGGRGEEGSVIDRQKAQVRYVRYGVGVAVKGPNIVFGVNFVSSSLSFSKYCSACTEGNYSYPYFKMLTG